MFAEDPGTISQEDSKKDVNIALIVREADATDDVEGYYSFRIGEVLNKKYQVIGFFGKGVYSNVLKARCLDTNDTVAIKLLRNNAHMKRSGVKEMKICKQLSDEDPENKYNIIKMYTSFVDKDHLCLVFEPMDMNLRQLLKKYGKKIGLNIKAVRFYAYKLIKALTLLKKCNLIHSDIKPDNILVEEDGPAIKLGDFGTAFYSEEAELGPMLGSRYYRAPEVILGMKHSFPIDMFSVGCCLYEIATGKYMLPSKDNNHHIQLLIEAKGPFPKKMLSLCELKSMHFDEDGCFLKRSIDNISGKEIVSRLPLQKMSSRNIKQELIESYSKDKYEIPQNEMEIVNNLADLIDKCTTLDPRHRITPEDAMKHPLFFTINNKQKK